MTYLIAVFVLALSLTCAAQPTARSIAVTIDDLPVVSTRRDIQTLRQFTTDLLAHIVKAKVPAIGFVNENKLYNGDKRDEKQVDLLRMWLDAGLELGNHTFSHRSADAIELDAYTDDIARGEAITKALLKARKMEIKYFRHPFLQTGSDLAKKNAIYRYLKEHGYTVAPVSVDNSDWIFARAYDNAFDKGDRDLMKRVGEAYVPYLDRKIEYWERQSVKLFGREIRQTLLLHANFINSHYFDDIVRMLKKRGYRFVTLENALEDEAYRLPDNFTRRAGISWLHRWALDRGREYVLPNEPMTPDFVMKAAGVESE